ncbi:MAG: UvrD-helicase domain-containing protein [Aeromonas jandaei]
MLLTEKQNKIVFNKNKITMVNACAGSGKTTTLKALFEQHPDKKILYIVYNKSMADEAKRDIKLPNVDIYTFHSLAYNRVNVGKYYKEKLSNSYTAIDIIEDLGLHQKDYKYAYDLRTMWQEFLVSGKRTIAEFVDEKYPFHSNRLKIIRDIRRIFNAKQDINNKAKIEHDFYVLLFYLFDMKLSEYDMLAVDEAQDSSHIILNLFKNFEGIKIAVGDKRQNIYAYRNTVNMFDHVDNAVDMPLDESHRVSQEIADICSMMYGQLIGENFDMTGTNSKNIIVNMVNPNNRHAIICRNNSTMLFYAIEAYERGQKLYFEGGFDSCKFGDYLDFYWFKRGKRGSKFRVSILNQMKNWEELIEYMKETDDEDLKTIMQIVMKYGDELPQLLDNIRRVSVRHKHESDVMMSTIHKSKGMTIDIPLIVANDVADIAALYDVKRHMSKQAWDKRIPAVRDHLNVLYVALTRGKAEIQIPEKVINFIGRF